MNMLILCFTWHLSKSPALCIHPSAQEEKGGLIFGKACMILQLFCCWHCSACFRGIHTVSCSLQMVSTRQKHKLLPPVMNQDNQDRNYGEDSNIFLNADLQRGGGKPCPKPNTEPFLPGQVTHVSQTEDRLSDCLPGGWKGPLFSTTSG